MHNEWHDVSVDVSKWTMHLPSSHTHIHTHRETHTHTHTQRLFVCLFDSLFLSLFLCLCVFLLDCVWHRGITIKLRCNFHSSFRVDRSDSTKWCPVNFGLQCSGITILYSPRSQKISQKFLKFLPLALVLNFLLKFFSKKGVKMYGFII